MQRQYVGCSMSRLVFCTCIPGSTTTAAGKQGRVKTERWREGAFSFSRAALRRLSQKQSELPNYALSTAVDMERAGESAPIGLSIG